MTTYDYAVAGGGIIGLATAYKLLEQNPRAAVVLFEKEETVGATRAATTAACCTPDFTTNLDR